MPFGKVLPAFQRKVVPHFIGPSSQNRVDFEMSVTIYPTAQRNIPEIENLGIPLCKCIRSKINYVCEEQHK